MFLYLYILLKRNCMIILSVKRLKIRARLQTLAHKLAHIFIHSRSPIHSKERHAQYRHAPVNRPNTSTCEQLTVRTYIPED